MLTPERIKGLAWTAGASRSLLPSAGLCNVLADAVEDLAEEALRLRAGMQGIADGPGMLRVREEVRRVLGAVGLPAA